MYKKIIFPLSVPDHLFLESVCIHLYKLYILYKYIYIDTLFL